MSYIKTGTMAKYFNSPTPKWNDEILALQDRLDEAHALYDRLRCNDDRTWMPPKRDEETREQGKIVAALQAQYNALFDTINPEYVKHWRG